MDKDGQSQTTMATLNLNTNRQSSEHANCQLPKTTKCKTFSNQCGEPFEQNQAFYFKQEVLLLFLHKSFGTPEFQNCGNLVRTD